MEPEHTLHVPPSFLCPISHDLMWDPASVVESQQTYEHAKIVAWFASGKRTDPLTGADIHNPELVTRNVALRVVIEEWLQREEPFADLAREHWRDAKVEFLPEVAVKRRRTGELVAGEAEYQLAIQHSNGCGVTVDKSLAVGYMRRAADKGHATALCTLGLSTTSHVARSDLQLLAGASTLLEQAKQAHVRCIPSSYTKA